MKEYKKQALPMRRSLFVFSAIRLYLAIKLAMDANKRKADTYLLIFL
jgi:hypothetical protein